jgi:hypothetical protein
MSKETYYRRREEEDVFVFTDTIERPRAEAAPCPPLCQFVPV